MIDVVVSSCTVSVAAFTLLMNRLQPASQRSAAFSLLLICFFLIGIGPVAFWLTPSLVQFYISILPFTFYCLLPCLWMYQDTLISQTQWQWRETSVWHFLPLPFMVALGISIYCLPGDIFNQMFFAEQTENLFVVNILSFAFFLAVILWCTLSCVYLAKIFIRTLRVRRALHDIFSEHESRNLRWLSWVSILVIITWAYALLVLTFDAYLHNSAAAETAVLVLFASLVWLVCLNGLRQRPCFEGVNQDLSSVSLDNHKKNYERSGLKTADLEKIAKKLISAIHNDKLHLNSEINLAILAAHIKEPPQYVTQTLSQQLQTSFFDFINKARIAEAKGLLVDTQNSVLDIALSTGFNSRSSFYRAFKQFTGVTPSEYRKE